MNKDQTGFLRIIRAPFLSSIYAPLLLGTLIAVYISNTFSVAGFMLVLIMGTGLHIATNVYNDIYDTIQGTDKVNVHRNEFSGGSGVLLDNPQLMPRLYRITRVSLLVALAATIVLSFVIDKKLLPHLWALYLLSAFFSKYYTAAPIKLAYRGWGEVSVWFAFGPMAILVAAVSQGVGFHHVVITAMPITGISTSSILLLGQLIDLDADIKGGKLGVAARLGTSVTKWIYLIVQLILLATVLILALILVTKGYFLLLAVIPYVFLLPKIWKIVRVHHNNPDELKKAAGYNVQLHLLFSAFFIIGWILINVFN